MTSVCTAGHMVALEEYLAHALSQVRPLAAVEVGLAHASGRIAAAGIAAVDPAPAFTNSAMDGFGVRAADLPGTGMVRLPVCGDIPAGTYGTWTPGTAVRIMTGAPVPAGVDTVIPVELTDHPSTRAPLPEAVTLPGNWPEGKNIRVRGTDVAAGEELLAAGTILGGQSLAALAGVGVTRVHVWPRVRIGAIITGDEVVTSDPAPGQVLDSNSLLVGSAVENFGGTLIAARTSSDDEEEFARAVKGLLPAVDLLITTGGASVGAHDVARHVLTDLGVQFESVGIQPAKPQGFGLIGGVPVCALPGNPGAVHVSLHAIVRPIMARLGHAPLPTPALRVIHEGWHKRAGLRQFVPVRFTDDGVVPVIPGGVASHRVRSLALAQGLAVVAPEITEVRVGEELPVIGTEDLRV